MIKIWYGVMNHAIDITEFCQTYLCETIDGESFFIIPAGNSRRNKFFRDPALGASKPIMVETPNIITKYHENFRLRVNVATGVTIVNDDSWVYTRLSKIHSSLKFNHGSLRDEVPEQCMLIRYLRGYERVLEIGGNLGRASLVISKLLTSPDQHVVLESDPDMAKLLEGNRDLNGGKFHIEPSALSMRPLIQKDINTYEGIECPEGYRQVKTITLNQLRTKYNIKFDTLMIDCEGAFYPILCDMPNILDGIRLIIMENDYTDIAHKVEVDRIVRKRGFRRDYIEGGDWGPCAYNFFEVWVRN